MDTNTFQRLLVRAASRLGHALVRDDPVARADAIVVLGGDARHRVPHAAVLFHDGYAPRVLAVGGREDGGVAAEARRSARYLRLFGVTAVEVVAEAATSTRAEAEAVARRARERGWARVIVVTSPYHCWRAGKVFERALCTTSCELVVSASPRDPYDPDRWWRDRRQARQVRNEVVKYLIWRVRTAPGPLAHRS